MLFKLSLKNISKSIKDYAIYFFTLILGVAIFYVFNAIDDQSVMMKVSSTTAEIIKLMTNILSGVSVFVSIILAFLIVYASRFLIKRRNKEFGVYLTLGMSKKKISLILFIETLIIGIVSLVVGLGIGFLLSQLMSILVANMFEADLTRFQFVFSTNACIKTLIYFSIMYFVVMIFNTINISKCKLIDLMHSNKKSEKIKLKNPLFCTIVFIISCIALGFAYYQVTGGIEKMTYANSIFVPMGIGAVSTFFVFWSLSGLLLKIFISMKNTYYKGLNSFTLRQFSSKINTMTFSMTIICLMLFITICVLSSAMSMKISMTNNLKKLAPADVQIGKFINVTDYEHYSEKQIEDSKISIYDTLEKLGYDVDNKLKDIVKLDVYNFDNIDLKTSIGSYYDIAKDKYPLMPYNKKESIVKISDYNKIAKLFGLKEYTLNDDEYFKFLENIKTDIITTRRQILSQANNEVVLMYYRIGKGLIENSKYGNRFIDTLATDLKLDFPNMQGLSARNLRYMKRFAKEFEYDSILQHNVAKLPWTTITTIMDKIKDNDERIWYIEKTLENLWSRTVLEHQIATNLYERQALNDNKISNYKETLPIELGKRALEMLKDPYIFDIAYSENALEKDVENALVSNITNLLLEFR